MYAVRDREGETCIRKGKKKNFRKERGGAHFFATRRLSLV